MYITIIKPYWINIIKIKINHIKSLVELYISLEPFKTVSTCILKFTEDSSAEPCNSYFSKFKLFLLMTELNSESIVKLTKWMTELKEKLIE